MLNGTFDKRPRAGLPGTPAPQMTDNPAPIPLETKRMKRTTLRAIAAFLAAAPRAVPGRGYPARPTKAEFAVCRKVVEPSEQTLD
jgi:hypothetical protein